MYVKQRHKNETEILRMKTTITKMEKSNRHVHRIDRHTEAKTLHNEPSAITQCREKKTEIN